MSSGSTKTRHLNRLVRACVNIKGEKAISWLFHDRCTTYKEFEESDLVTANVVLDSPTESPSGGLILAAQIGQRFKIFPEQSPNRIIELGLRGHMVLA